MLVFFEVDYGLGKDWSVGLELPGVIAGQTRKLEGLALELQYVAPHDKTNGWYWGIRGDVAHQSSVYESEAGNSIDLNPIIGYRNGPVHAVLNPSLEVPFQSEEPRVTFQPAAKLTTRVAEGQELGVEYYGNWGPFSALLPLAKRDETLYAVWEKNMSFGHLNIGFGRGLHPDGGSADRWVGKVDLQFELDRTGKRLCKRMVLLPLATASGLSYVLDACGQFNPGVHAFFVHRERGCGKGWVCERTDGNGDAVFETLAGVVHRDTTCGAEVERAPASGITDPNERV